MSGAFVHFMRWCVGVDKPTTQTTLEEREMLVKYAKGRKRLVEVGVWEGVTARQILASSDRDAIYFAVDPYAPGRLGFSTQKIISQRNVGSIAAGRVVWIRGTGVEASQDKTVRSAPVDFVFLDGDHSYRGLQQDWDSWSGLIAVGGVVCLHDSRSSPKRIIETAGSLLFTEEVIRRDSRFELVDEVDSLTVFVRKNNDDC